MTHDRVEREDALTIINYSYVHKSSTEMQKIFLAIELSLLFMHFIFI